MASSLSTVPPPEPPDEISRDELQRRLANRSLIAVDVLPKESYAAGHIPGAINLPLAELAERAPAILADHAAEIAIYCASFT